MTRPAWPGAGWRIYTEPRVLSILFLGFASGLPILLVLGTLSAWLRDAQVDRSTIGLFGFVLAPYTFKFAWAPLMDRLALPPLTTWLGRRRGWMLATQLGLIAAIWGLGQSDPATDLFRTALLALVVAFLSASQDIVIDAYRVEILPTDRLGAGAGMVQIGYRIGMWCAGAGALLVADRLGWSAAYATMAALVLVGVATVLAVPEPEGSTVELPDGRRGLRAWLEQAVVAPFRDFFRRQGMRVALVVLLFISLYKACDVLLTLMANPFYLDVGFSKTDIAEISGTFGIFATLAGGVVGGTLVYRLGILRALLVGGVLQAASNLMFAVLAAAGPSRPVFYLTVAVENLSGGLGTSAFVAYLSSLCNVHYTAVQYALLTSFMQMLAKYVIVPSSGFYADAVGWHAFFVSSTLLALPGLLLVLWLQRHGLEVPTRAPPVAPAVGASSGEAARIGIAGT